MTGSAQCQVLGNTPAVTGHQAPGERLRREGEPDTRLRMSCTPLSAPEMESPPSVYRLVSKRIQRLRSTSGAPLAITVLDGDETRAPYFRSALQRGGTKSNREIAIPSNLDVNDSPSSSTGSTPCSASHALYPPSTCASVPRPSAITAHKGRPARIAHCVP